MADTTTDTTTSMEIKFPNEITLYAANKSNSTFNIHEYRSDNELLLDIAVKLYANMDFDPQLTKKKSYNELSNIALDRANAMIKAWRKRTEKKK